MACVLVRQRKQNCVCPYIFTIDFLLNGILCVHHYSFTTDNIVLWGLLQITTGTSMWKCRSRAHCWDDRHLKNPKKNLYFHMPVSLVSHCSVKSLHLPRQLNMHPVDVWNGQKIKREKKVYCSLYKTESCSF